MTIFHFLLMLALINAIPAVIVGSALRRCRRPKKRRHPVDRERTRRVNSGLPMRGWRTATPEKVHGEYVCVGDRVNPNVFQVRGVEE